jgi:AcrR family transcriptional regulator
MARTKAPDHESQREQILDVAAEAFARASYPSTSMAELAAACGTSKARLYHYYVSKDAILFDLLDRYTKRLMLIIAEVEGTSQRRNLDERESFAEKQFCDADAGETERFEDADFASALEDERVHVEEYDEKADDNADADHRFDKWFQFGQVG